MGRHLLGWELPRPTFLRARATLHPGVDTGRAHSGGDAGLALAEQLDLAGGDRQWLDHARIVLYVVLFEGHDFVVGVHVLGAETLADVEDLRALGVDQLPVGAVTVLDEEQVEAGP